MLAASCEVKSEHVLVPGCLIDLTAALFPSDIYILLTECEGRTGRISARGLGSTDRAASARSDILPVRPEQTQSIRDLLHDF